MSTSHHHKVIPDLLLRHSNNNLNIHVFCWRHQLIQKEQLLQEVQKYAEVLQEQSHHGNHHQGDMEEKLKEFQQQTPLIETMQKELSSAQVGVYRTTDATDRNTDHRRR